MMGYIIGSIYTICFNDSTELAFPPETDRSVVEAEMKVLKKRYMKHNGMKEWPQHIYAHIDEIKLFQGG